MKTIRQNSNAQSNRAGSTLIIVIALLGLLAFTGMLMYTFAAQERAAAEYFSEGAKTQVEESDDPFPWALEQMIVGPSNQQKTSILWSPTRRYSFVNNSIGADVAPHTGSGFHVAYNATSGLPMVDNNYNGIIDGTIADPLGTDLPDDLSNRLNFVDAPVAWGQTSWGLLFGTSVEGVLGNRRDYLGSNAMPESDVDYTYPDINNLFLAYEGWSIRDRGVEEDTNLNGILDGSETDLNGNGVLDRRYERVFTIIPSFFRPQYMKSALNQGPNGKDAPTDPDWYNEVAHPDYSVRSFRPSALHVAGFDSANNPVRRFLDAINPLHAAAIAALPNASGPFPLRPGEGNTNHSNSTEFGRLGIWTGHGSASAATPALPATFELDSDNDGDGIREGIWLDLHYPLQETAGGVKYVVMHSFTIEDLDALIDLNSHGNLAGLPRTGTVPALVGAANLLANEFTSQSNQGIGPHEINPLYALGPFSSTLDTSTAFTSWYGANPSNRIEQANMEWMWLLAGRIDTTSATPEVLDGRWGDASALWYHFNGGGARSVGSLPRPGRSGNLAVATSNVAFNFGGLDGFDDNQDTLEGIASAQTGRIRGFVHPLDFAGRGRRTVVLDPRKPRMSPQVGTLPEQWTQYLDYPLVGNNSGVFDSGKYLGGQDGTIGNPTVTGDNLIAFSNVANPAYDGNFEDPYETIMDHDHPVRPDDQLYGISDMVSAHLTKTDEDSAEGLSDRLEKVAPITFADNSDRSSLFTTLSNSFRYFAIQHDLTMRPWEWTADSDGDNFLEFPPAFGPVGAKVLPFTAADPFRPQTRRLLFAEATEGRGVQGQLPLSMNHILDVNRSVETPLEGTPEFVNYMRRTGLRFRQLTEHPLGSESDGSGGQVMATVITVPTVTAGSPLPVFPPRIPGDREFWARRDRQLLARDNYVLLYTLGGARPIGAAIKDYTGTNNPALGESDMTASALYTHEQLRRMAQFAVNLVDAMDTDNVITKFEYDKNLGNGWSLDDDAYTADFNVGNVAHTDYKSLTKKGLYAEDQTVDPASNPGAIPERGVVYGVEAQELAFSEVLGIRSPDISDHVATPFGDAGTIHDFMFVEIQNMLPASQDLATAQSNSATTATWRLARYDRNAATDDNIGLPSAPNKAIVFLNNPDNVIQGGGRFSISGTSDAGMALSAFFVDTGDPTSGSFDGTFELVAPNATGVTLPTSPNTAGSSDAAYAVPLTDLDLIHTTHASGHFASLGGNFLTAVGNYNGNDAFNLPLDGLDSDSGAQGDFFGNSSSDGFDLVLQRRLNPNLPKLNETDNPWVEVDRTRMTMKIFGLTAGDTADKIYTPAGAMAASGYVLNLASTERSEPLDDGSRKPSVAAPVAYRLNTIKGDLAAASNDAFGMNAANAAAPFQLWQAHFDRDYASPGELFNLPIVGPNLLTQRLKRMTFSPYLQGFRNPTIPLNAELDPERLSGAAAMLLQADFPDLIGTLDPTDIARDNRWYRLLQFVEVPSRVNRMLGNYISIKRLPGKLNANTIRNREVYSGLLDDTELMNVLARPAVDFNGNGDEDGPFAQADTTVGADGIDTVTASGIRDRWLEFINERDGNVLSGYFDPTPAMPSSGDEVPWNNWIPGTPNSRPFRSLSHRTPRAVGDDNGLEDTLLRRFAVDKPAVATGSRSNVAGEGNGLYNNEVTVPNLATNRHWLEVGNRAYHVSNAGGPSATTVEHHQLLSRIMNNTTTVSNTFIIYGTAAYFEAYEDPATGLIQVGGRMGLDLDSDSDQTNDAGWEQRAVFIIDRTELYNAYDPGTGSVDWKRLIKNRTNLASDGK